MNSKTEWVIEKDQNVYNQIKNISVLPEGYLHDQFTSLTIFCTSNIMARTNYVQAVGKKKYSNQEGDVQIQLQIQSISDLPPRFLWKCKFSPRSLYKIPTLAPFLLTRCFCPQVSSTITHIFSNAFYLLYLANIYISNLFSNKKLPVQIDLLLGKTFQK